jgi:hypothetical protein
MSDSAEEKKDDGPLGALNGLWGGITQVAEDAKKATESGLKQIPGLPNNQLTKEQIKDLFKEFDKDRNNILDPQELQDFAYSLGETWSEETCKKILDKLDTDKSGGLDIDEFSAWFLTPGAVSEIAQNDDMFTKLTLGPQLFARHAQRKAKDASAGGVEGIWGGVVKAAEDAKAMAEKAADDAKKAAENATAAASGAVSGGGNPPTSPSASGQ